jgi:hypothetical protein
MVLLAVVGLILVQVVASSARTIRFQNDESQGLADVKTGAERLARDVRDARGITVSTDPTVTATSSQLTVWIDYNSDYVQSNSETITWRLQNATGGHYNLVRVVKSGGTAVEARTLVSNLAFTYCTDTTCTTTPTSGMASQVTLVSVDMTYDSMPTAGASQRHVAFKARLRNVGT